MDNIRGLKNPILKIPVVHYSGSFVRKPAILERITRFFRKFWLPTIMLIPAFVLYMAFFIIPTLYSFYLSFHDWNLLTGEIYFEGLDNYIEVLTDPVFFQSVRNMIVYVVCTTIPVVIGAMLVAIIIENCGKTKGIYRTLMYIPSVISMSVAGMMWQFVLNPTGGIVNQILSCFGVSNINWLTDVRTALWVIVVVGIWRGLGNNVVLFIAGLKGISNEQLEAARVDGANALQVFRYITLPSISYVTVFVSITTIIASFQVFTVIQVMTMGGPNNATNMPVFQLWQEAFQFFDMGRATSISTILFIALFILSMMAMNRMEKNQE